MRKKIKQIFRSLKICNSNKKTKGFNNHMLSNNTFPTPTDKIKIIMYNILVIQDPLLYDSNIHPYQHTFTYLQNQ